MKRMAQSPSLVAQCRTMPKKRTKSPNGLPGWAQPLTERESLIKEGERLRRVLSSLQDDPRRQRENPLDESGLLDLMTENEALQQQLQAAEQREVRTRVVALEPSNAILWLLGLDDGTFFTSDGGVCVRCNKFVGPKEAVVPFYGRELYHAECLKLPAPTSDDNEGGSLYRPLHPKPPPEAIRAAEGKSIETLREENEVLLETIRQIEAERVDSDPLENDSIEIDRNGYLHHSVAAAEFRTSRDDLFVLTPVDKLRWVFRLKPRRYVTPRGTPCARCKQLIRGRLEVHGQEVVHVKCPR